VDAADALPGQDSSGFFGDIKVNLNVVDSRNPGETVTNSKTVSVEVDIDVEAVNDPSTLPNPVAVSEATVDAAGGWLEIPLSPANPDMDGSETIESLAIFGIPKGVVVFYEDGGGNLVPAKLIRVEPGNGTTDWVLEGGQWSTAVLRGIPEHFSGVVTADPVTGELMRSTDGSTNITAQVLTREFNDNETGQTNTGPLVIEVTPSVDGGNPNQTYNILEDTAFNPGIDGNLIDKSDDSPEELVGNVIISLDSGLPTSFGVEARFFIGDPAGGGTEIFPDVNGDMVIDSADISDFFVVPPKDSNEDFTLGIEYTVREATDPTGPTKTENGTLTINVKGVADTPTITVPAGGASEAYTGDDSGAFLLDTSVLGPDGAATRLGGMMQEIMPDGINFDGSENLFFVITGDSLSTVAPGGGLNTGTPSVSFQNGVDTGAGAIIVSAADIGNLEFVPVNVNGQTDYQFTLTAIVVEDDEMIPSGSSLTDAAALEGVAIAQADFYVQVTDAGGGGGGDGCDIDDLPDPPDVTISPIVGVEDQEAMFTLTLNNYGGDFSNIPNGGSIQITGIPNGSLVRAEPADAISYNPVTGTYFVNTAIVDASTEFFVTYPEHVSSANTPFDGLDEFSVTSLSLDADCGFSNSVEQVTTVYIEPVADAPKVNVSSAGGLEDNTIPFSIGVALVDPGETIAATLEVTIDASLGVIADAGGTPLTPVSSAGGVLTYEVPSGTASLNLIPTTHLHGDIPINVKATSVEPNGDTASTTATVVVGVEAIADTGLVDVDISLPTGNDNGDILPLVTTLEDVDILLESVISTSTPDTDGSEVYNITISGIPDFLTVNVGTDNGLDGNGLRSFTLTPAEYSQLKIGLVDENARTPDSLDATLPDQVRLTLEVNTLELSNGDTNFGIGDFLFKVLPDADVPTVSVSDTSTTEDMAVALSISGAVTDPHEEIAEFIIRDVPAGGQILVDGIAVATGPAEATIDAADIGKVSFLPPPDASGDFTLKVVSVSSEPTVADQNAANATEESLPADLVVSVAPAPDIDLSASAQDVAQTGQPILVDIDVSAAVTDSVGPVAETLDEVTISFNGLPSGTTFNVGTLNPDGDTLTVSRSAFGSEQAFITALATIMATLPGDFFGDITAQAQAMSSEGQSAPFNFGFNVNGQPTSASPLTLDREDVGEFTLSEADLLSTYSDPDGDMMSVSNVQTTSPDAMIVAGPAPGTWVVTVNDGFEGDIPLTYTVTDDAGVPAMAAAMATVSVDNRVELQMADTGIDQQVTDGVTGDLLDDVTGTAGTYNVAEGTGNNDVVEVDGTRDYEEVEEISTLSGQDLVDLSQAARGFTVDLGEGNDFAIGSNAADILKGGGGADRLDGGAGANTLEGGSGADTFVISSTDAIDFIADYSSADGDVVDLTALFDVAGSVNDYVQYDNATGNLSVDVDGSSNGQNFAVSATLGMMPATVTINIDDGSSESQVTI
ncbi:type I secretion C-terminal target domain-containing protein, partial [Rhodobacteraceae bacterium RKSG542]|uniref:cadherin-like domain-containing protein n=1 Tax=Pseudovibrio flavus TaxID=2529854 RepID=UPI0012BB920E